MDTTAPKSFVFVLMPFSEDFRDIYELGIKQACQNAGAYCERVDEQIFHENILERVYSQIAKADVIVADMTGRNPNVFYEVGYAHALNKKVILLTRNADDIPFDLKHYSHIVYEGKITNLLSQLESRVKHFTRETDYQNVSVDSNFDFYFDGKLIKGVPSIACCVYLSCDYEEELWLFDSSLHVYNNTDKMISNNDCKVAVVLPKDYLLIGESVVDRVNLPDDTTLSFLGLPGTMFPGEWKELKLRLALMNTTTFGTELPCKIRVLKQAGAIEHSLIFDMDVSAILESRGYPG